MTQAVPPKNDTAAAPPNRVLDTALRLLAPLVALALMVVIFTILTGGAYLRSLPDVATQAAIIVIVGIGQTLVIIAGGIDLSVGAVMALSGTLSAVLMLNYHVSPPLAALAGVLVGGVIGLFNGFITVKTRLHPFIITLGAMMIVRGLAQALTGAQNTALLPDQFQALGSSDALAVPLGAGRELVAWPGKPFLLPGILGIYIVVLAFGAQVLLARTRGGRYCYAIGSNPQSARLSGVPVDRWMVLYFVLAGLLFGFGGVVDAARAGIGQPNGAQGMELEAVAAAVIGGASLSGGRGTTIGAAIGAFLMAGLRVGLRLLNLQPYWQLVALGAAIIAAVIYDRASRRQRD